jgi:hypothetical protein
LQLEKRFEFRDFTQSVFQKWLDRIPLFVVHIVQVVFSSLALVMAVSKDLPQANFSDAETFKTRS